MPDSTLRQLVLKRLEAETRAEDEWSALGSYEGQNAGEVVAQGIGRRGPVDLPPAGGSFYLTRRAAREDDRQGRHVLPDSRRSSSAAK
jgi:hypothetical protein